MTEKTYHNGNYETYEYDEMGRVTDLDLYNYSDALIRKFDYSYDELSNIDQTVETRPGPTVVTKDYGYDEISQLVSEDWSTGYSADYVYDENGNRTQRTVGGTVQDYTYDASDKLVQIDVNSSMTESFAYDYAGRRVERYYSGATTYYGYDQGGRLNSVTRSGSTSNSYAYNGFDTRASKTDSLGTTSFKRAGAGVTSPLLKSAVSGGSTTDYTPGVSSRVSSTTTYGYSGLKNTDEQSGSASRQYDAFGKQVSSSGSWVGPYGYGGKFGYQTDPDYGLKLLGHRYYDSESGTFLSKDPAKDGRNLYGYCGSNPVLLADPSGLLPDWLENSWKSIKDIGSEAGHVIKFGLKVIFIVPAVLEFRNAVIQAKQEKDYFVEYRTKVNDAVASGQTEVEHGYELIKLNQPSMQGPLGVIKRWWELLIDVT